MASPLPKSSTERQIRNPLEYAERHLEEHAASPEDIVTSDEEPPHNASLTAVATEALRTGLFPLPEDPEVPGQDDILRAGDVDVDPLSNLYSGDEMPGGSMPTPDQSNVEDAGRAAGLSAEDNGELRSAEEIAERRDERRWEHEPLSPKT